MNAATKERAATEEGVDLFIPQKLLERFEAVHREIRAAYGHAPDASSLMRFWLTCSTISQIRREFEAAVLEINENVIPDDEAEDDGDDL